MSKSITPDRLLNSRLFSLPTWIFSLYPQIVQTRIIPTSTIARSLHASPASWAVNVNDYRANREKFPEDDRSTRYTAGQGPSALDKASQSLLLTELVRGMWVVLESFFRPPYTLMYPFEKGALSPRFRGEHALRRYPSGKQKRPLTDPRQKHFKGRSGSETWSYQPKPWATVELVLRCDVLYGPMEMDESEDTTKVDNTGPQHIVRQHILDY